MSPNLLEDARKLIRSSDSKHKNVEATLVSAEKLIESIHYDLFHVIGGLHEVKI